MRRFAVGTRGTLLLARRPSRGDRDSSAPRLLKVFHPETPASSVDVELTALSTVEIPHVVRLIDIASIEAGQPPCLIMEKLSGPTLASYLGRRATVSAGQAVTILAPLCAAVYALHDAGVTHGSIHVRRIVFDRRGAPTLTGFGRGMLRQVPDTGRVAALSPRGDADRVPDDSRESSWRAAVLDDHRDLLGVIDEVLLRVDDAPSVRSRVDVSTLAGEIGKGPTREFLPRLETMLFALATPQVVAVDGMVLGEGAHSDEKDPTTPVRVAVIPPTGDYDWTQSRPRPSPPPSESRLVAALRVLGASSAVLETVSGIADAAARLTARGQLHQGMPASDPTDAAAAHPTKRGARRPILVGATCLVLATTAVLLALPSPGDEARAGAREATRTHVPTNELPTGDAAGTESIDGLPALLGDDAAEALRALTGRYDSCTAVSDHDDCLASVFQPDYLASLAKTDSPMAIDAGDAIVTGSWGGSALVSARLNDQRASFLLTKGETGWRVRDVFVGD